jgi:hypothetical protein
MLNLPHGAALEASLATPQPECFGIMGQGMEQQTVVGMLGVPLEVKVKLDGKLIMLRLEQVLVIDRLPVPLQISMKRLGDDASNPDLDDLTHAMQNRDHSIHVAFNQFENGNIWEPIDVSAPPPPQELPAEFHDHTYWTGSMYLGYAGEAHGGALHNHIASKEAQTVQAVQRFICVCGVTEKPGGAGLMQCSKCRNAWYCCVEHQREDWKSHKRVCVGRV